MGLVRMPGNKGGRGCAHPAPEPGELLSGARGEASEVMAVPDSKKRAVKKSERIVVKRSKSKENGGGGLNSETKDRGPAMERKKETREKE